MYALGAWALAFGLAILLVAGALSPGPPMPGD